MESSGVKSRNKVRGDNANNDATVVEPLRTSVTKNLFGILGNLFGVPQCSQNADVAPSGLYKNCDMSKNRAGESVKQEKSSGAADEGKNTARQASQTNKRNGRTEKKEDNSKKYTFWKLPYYWLFGQSSEQQKASAASTEDKKDSSSRASGKDAKVSKKSVFWAYFFWLFGGVFGLHLFYLERDAQAFLTWSTLGGYGLGWLADITKIPRYVRDCNNDPKFLDDLVERMRRNRKPPFCTSRFISALMIGYLWGQLILLAIPQDEVWGVNWNTYFHWFIPLGVALGVWVVGNIGREQGKPWLTIVVSYVSYLTRWYFYDENFWLTIVMFAAALTFDTWSKEWKRAPKKKKSFLRRAATLTFCAMLYIGLWSSYLYFNGKVTDSNGDEIPVHEALHHFFTSSWWTDFKQSLYEVYQYAQHHGWYEIWKQVIELSDPQGEQNAYKTLGVGPTSSQQEITSRWRKLSRENHPDKCKDPDKLREAQERFMEIQQAYEILSNIKNNRRRKNKKSVHDDL